MDCGGSFFEALLRMVEVLFGSFRGELLIVLTPLSDLGLLDKLATVGLPASTPFLLLLLGDLDILSCIEFLSFPVFSFNLGAQVAKILLKHPKIEHSTEILGGTERNYFI
jgi:hypothetical protein